MNFLKRLFGRKEEPVELPPEFLQSAPPDWLIELKGQLAPSGGRFSIRAQLSEASRTGLADVLVLPAEPGAEPRTAAVELERLEFDRLLVVLGFSFPGDIAEVAAGTESEPAASLAIHRREPYETASAECCLAGRLDSRKSEPPVVEIGRILIGAMRRAMTAI